MTEQATQQQGKPQNSYIAIISYLTLIGWVIAFILYKNDEKNQNEFNAFHIRQTLGIMLLGLIGGFIPFVNFIVLIYNLVCWIIGFISALQGTQKKVPLLGEKYQQWFKGVA